MDMNDRMMFEGHGMSQGYDDRMDESLGTSHRGSHSQSMRDRRTSRQAWNGMGRRKYSRVGIDRGNRMMAESKFDRLSKEIEDEYVEKGMSREEAEKIGDATAAKIGRAKYGKRGMANKSRRARRAEMTRDDRDMMIGMERTFDNASEPSHRWLLPKTTLLWVVSLRIWILKLWTSSAGTGDKSFPLTLRPHLQTILSLRKTTRFRPCKGRPKQGRQDFLLGTNCW